MDTSLIGSTYNRAICFAGSHTTLGARLPEPALETATDWASADDRYEAGEGANVVLVDNALSAAALEDGVDKGHACGSDASTERRSRAPGRPAPASRTVGRTSLGCGREEERLREALLEGGARV